jgi:hypothetical protein
VAAAVKAAALLCCWWVCSVESLICRSGFANHKHVDEQGSIRNQLPSLVRRENFFSTWMLKNNLRILKNHSAKLKLQLAKLKLQPDLIARQPHASFAKKFAPDRQWHVLENFVNTHYRLFCSILPHVPGEEDLPCWPRKAEEKAVVKMTRRTRRSPTVNVQSSRTQPRTAIPIERKKKTTKGGPRWFLLSRRTRRKERRGTSRKPRLRGVMSSAQLMDCVPSNVMLPPRTIGSTHCPRRSVLRRIMGSTSFPR